jgi:alkanesulfonate monooxygenase SsuD/methylene tetrahydromethanopterin reductase-like flavin-dependent oxidoreductase (luciferase family)
MKLGLAIGYSGPHLDVPVALVQPAEELRCDTVWPAEAYGSDATTRLAFLAAMTNRIKLSCLLTDDAERDWPAVRAAERYCGCSIAASTRTRALPAAFPATHGWSATSSTA